MWSSRLRLIAISACTLTLAPIAVAKNLGAIGPTYPVIEEDLAAAMTSRMAKATGDWERLRAETLAQAKGRVAATRAAAAIPPARTSRSFLYDPTITARVPITDARGQVILPAGARFNPLDRVSLERPLLFFDGRDARQVQYVRRHIAEKGRAVVLIVVGGAARNLQQKLALPIYADPSGVLSTKFRIKALPAIVSQEGRALRVDEVTP